MTSGISLFLPGPLSMRWRLREFPVTSSTPKRQATWKLLAVANTTIGKFQIIVIITKKKKKKRLLEIRFLFFFFLIKIFVHFRSTGYFIQPTLITTKNPNEKIMTEEIFGPVLTIYIYKDSQLDETMKLVETSTPYALTGAIFTEDE